MTSLVIWDTKIKTKKYHDTTIRTAKMKDLMPSIVEDVEQLELTYSAAENAQ